MAARLPLLLLLQLLVAAALGLTLAEPQAPAQQQQRDGGAGQHVLAELHALRQQLAQLQGAHAVGGPAGAAAMQPFLPSTANTARTVAVRASPWPRHYGFLSAVAGDAAASASHVATDTRGGTIALVLGDAAGWLYFFTPEGHLLHEHDTGTGSRITALSSQAATHNTTHLLLGTHDGTLGVLSVTHEGARSPAAGITGVAPLLLSTAADRAAQVNMSAEACSQPIRHVMFGKGHQRRMLLAVDSGGTVLLLMLPSGRVAMRQPMHAGQPLDVWLNSNFQLIVQTSTSTAVLLMKRGRSRVVRPCVGLAPSAQPSGQAGPGGAAPEQEQEQEQEQAARLPDELVAAAFDPTRPFRVYGVTAGGELVLLMVPSGVAAHACRVLQRMPLGLPPGPVRLLASKGRLVLLHAAGVAVFDVSAHRLALASSAVVSHTWHDLWRLYGLEAQQQALQQGQQDGTGDSSSSSSTRGEALLHSEAWGSALTAAAAEPGLLLLPLGDRGVAAFAAGGGAAGADDAGAGWASPSHDANWLRLAQPLIVIGMAVVGVWQFVRASNRAGSSLGGGRFGPEPPGLAGLAGGSAGAADLAHRFAMLGGGGGGFGSLDRDFGPYTGPRTNRERERERDLLLSGHGGLTALTARRRARAAMLGARSAEREQRSLGAGAPGGPGRAALAGRGGLRQQDGLAPGARPGVGRRVQFEGVAESAEQEEEQEEQELLQPAAAACLDVAAATSTAAAGSGSSSPEQLDEGTAAAFAAAGVDEAVVRALHDAASEAGAADA